MDGHRFDTLIRAFAQRDAGRRSALRLLAGSALSLVGVLSTEDADAHNALTKCRKIEDKKKRAKCVKAAKKHNKGHKDEDTDPDLECDPPCPARQGCARVGCVEGECVLLSQPAPRGEICRPAAGQCDIFETCNGDSLNCPSNQFRPSTDQCRAAQCLSESTARLAAHCTGNTPDCPPSTVQDCDLFRCHNNKCDTTCTYGDARCVNGAWCNGGGCAAKQTNGTSCSAATPLQCQSGHCVGGTCCPGQCPARANATTICPGGSCQLVCNEGWANCNQNQSDGCEIHLLSDPDYCGSCGAPPCRGTCGNFNQGTRECINGRCDCVINP